MYYNNDRRARGITTFIGMLILGLTATVLRSDEQEVAIQDALTVKAIVIEEMLDSAQVLVVLVNQGDLPIAIIKGDLASSILTFGHDNPFGEHAGLRSSWPKTVEDIVVGPGEAIGQVLQLRKRSREGEAKLPTEVRLSIRAKGVKDAEFESIRLTGRVVYLAPNE